MGKKNCIGKIRVQVVLTDMFNEHVWEIYFMVSRSPQAFYFSQTCSLNMSGKLFDTMGVPREGYISQTCSSKTPKKNLPRFFFNGCGVGDGGSRRLEFQYNPLSR